MKVMRVARVADVRGVCAVVTGHRYGLAAARPESCTQSPRSILDFATHNLRLTLSVLLCLPITVPVHGLLEGLAGTSQADFALPSGSLHVPGDTV